MGIDSFLRPEQYFAVRVFRWVEPVRLPRLEASFMKESLAHALAEALCDGAKASSARCPKERAV
jgi:hypothetical protein